MYKFCSVYLAQDPQLPEKWTGILEARYEGPPPFAFDQFGLNTIDPTSSEDCLKLNVFSRQTNTNHRAPVMVFIYGGGFIQGSSQQLFYSPDFFMQKDVVVVTFNYRIGALGKYILLKRNNLDKQYKM